MGSKSYLERHIIFEFGIWCLLAHAQPNHTFVADYLWLLLLLQASKTDQKRFICSTWTPNFLFPFSFSILVKKLIILSKYTFLQFYQHWIHCIIDCDFYFYFKVDITKFTCMFDNNLICKKNTSFWKSF